MTTARELETNFKFSTMLFFPPLSYVISFSRKAIKKLLTILPTKMISTTDVIITNERANIITNI
jgi:hypothetical protein